MNGYDIRLERVIDAPPEDAFHHWTDPVARQGWYAPDDSWTVEAATDLRVGGTWSVSFGPSEVEMYRDEGVFSVVDPPHRLEYNALMSFPDGRSFETLITVTFEATRDGKTRFTLLDRGYPSEEQRDEHESGWPSFLDAFERTLARRTS